MQIMHVLIMYAANFRLISWIYVEMYKCKQDCVYVVT